MWTHLSCESHMDVSRNEALDAIGHKFMAEKNQALIKSLEVKRIKAFDTPESIW